MFPLIRVVLLRKLPTNSCRLEKKFPNISSKNYFLNSYQNVENPSKNLDVIFRIPQIQRTLNIINFHYCYCCDCKLPLVSSFTNPIEPLTPVEPSPELITTRPENCFEASDLV